MVPQPFFAPGADGRSSVVFAAVVGMVLSAFLLVLVVVHAGRPEHDLPPSAVAMGVAGAVASAAGWALIARSGDGFLLAVALLGLLLVAGVVSLLSIGLLLLLVGAGAAVVVGRVAARRRVEGRPVSGRRAVAVAALVGLGLPVVALVATDGPVVRCHVNGVSTSESLFRSSSSGSGSGGTSMSGGGPGNESTGAIVQGGRAYRYRCVGAELVEFEARDA